MRRVAVVVVVLTVAVLWSGASPAVADDVYVGACTFDDLDVTFSPALTLVPATTTVTLASPDGACSTSGGDGSGAVSLSVTVEVAAFSCLAGAARGEGSLDVDPQFAASWSVDVVVTTAPGAWAVAAWHQGTLVAKGTFTPSLPPAGDCAGAGVEHATADGAIAFVKNEIPVA